MNTGAIAEALGWQWVGQTDVGDRAPAWYDVYEKSDGKRVSAEPPYFEAAVVAEIKRLRAESAPAPNGRTLVDDVLGLLALAAELQITHPDPYDAGHRIEQFRNHTMPVLKRALETSPWWPA